MWRGSSALPTYRLPISELVPIPMTVILISVVIRSLAAARPIEEGPQLRERLAAGAAVSLTEARDNGGVRETAQPA